MLAVWGHIVIPPDLGSGLSPLSPPEAPYSIRKKKNEFDSGHPPFSAFKIQGANWHFNYPQIQEPGDREDSFSPPAGLYGKFPCFTQNRALWPMKPGGFRKGESGVPSVWLVKDAPSLRRRPSLPAPGPPSSPAPLQGGTPAVQQRH